MKRIFKFEKKFKNSKIFYTLDETDPTISNTALEYDEEKGIELPNDNEIIIKYFLELPFGKKTEVYTKKIVKDIKKRPRLTIYEINDKFFKFSFDSDIDILYLIINKQVFEEKYEYKKDIIYIKEINLTNDENVISIFGKNNNGISNRLRFKVFKR